MPYSNNVNNDYIKSINESKMQNNMESDNRKNTKSSFKRT